MNTSYLIDAGLSRETIENILPFIEFGRSRKVDFNLVNYLRSQDSSENFRTVNRLEAKNNVFDLRLHQEYNTTIENTPIPFGASLSIKRSPTGRLILGQYQINHAYGLLISRGSFISQKPGFNTDFRQNRTILSANAKPYHSRSFFGAAYEKAFSEHFSMILFSSFKNTGARLIFNYQTREYPDYEIQNKGYALSQNIAMQFKWCRASFTGGIFDTEIPIYLYLYSGRLNNSMFVLSGEGEYAMLHLNIPIKEKWTIELMSSVLKKENLEYNASIVFGYGF